jgi:hypothetical protein
MIVKTVGQYGSESPHTTRSLHKLSYRSHQPDKAYRPIGSFPVQRITICLSFFPPSKHDVPDVERLAFQVPELGIKGDVNETVGISPIPCRKLPDAGKAQRERMLKQEGNIITVSR